MKSTIFALLALLLLVAPAHARDGYADNGRPLVCNPLEFDTDKEGLKKCQIWISSVKQPHSKTTCCGEADAYIADEWEVGEDGGWVAIISRDYPGNPIGTPTPPVPAGTRIPIPAQRMDDEHQGNPTGHGVVFMARTSDGQWNVLCYFTKTLA